MLRITDGEQIEFYATDERTNPAYIKKNNGKLTLAQDVAIIGVLNAPSITSSQITVNGATPLVIQSTSLIANLNADLLDGHHSNEFMLKSGGVISGKLLVSQGADGGIAFPDNAFGGSGDTASITLQSTGGENQELIIQVANEITDIIHLKAPSNNGVKINNNIVWNAGNDGASSGLDADLLDGQHGSYYAAATHNHDTAYVKLAGSAMTGRLIVPSGSSGGVAFPDNAFGGTGDAASITLQSTSGENQELTIQVANEATDIIHLKTPDKNGVKINSNTVWHAGNDGAGSGLDADLIDGIDSSDLVQHSDIVCGYVCFESKTKRTTRRWIHNLGTTNYRVCLATDSPERHIYYQHKTANYIEICVDDIPYNDINVDITLIKGGAAIE